MRKSKSRSARRSARRSRSMRGGRLTSDSSYSTYLNSDNTSDITGSSGAALQNSDRNSSSIAGEGAPINMSSAAYQGLYPPNAYYGGKRGRKSRRGSKSRRGRKMRGGKSTAQLRYGTLPNPDTSEGANDDVLVGRFAATHNNIVPTQLFQGAIGAPMSGGRRRRRRSMKGGADSTAGGSRGVDGYGAADIASAEENIAEANEFDKSLEYNAQHGIPLGGSRRRRRRSMRGGEEAGPMPTKPENDKTPIEGMYDNNQNPVSPNAGGGRRKKRGGGIIATAALPFGLFGLQRLFQSRNASKTRKHRR